MDNTGDFNAIIGTKTTKEDFKSMGKLGIWKRSKRGDRLIEFAEEHKLMIANTLFYFRNKKKKKKTPKNQILDLGVTRWGNKKPDRFTQTNQRGIATNCKVTTKADIGLVRVTLRMNKRLARLKNLFFFFFF